MPVKKHARSALDGRRRISVPCPHDPCPDLVDLCRAAQEGFQKYGALFLPKKKRLRQRTQKLRAFKNMGAFFAEKRRLRQRTQKLRACKNMGAFFAEKKSACGNVPTSSGLVKICPLGIQAEKQGFRTVRLITGQKFP